MGLHLIRRLRFMDHVPGTNKSSAIEVYAHARTLFLVSDSDLPWTEWMMRIDKAMRDSTFDFREESEKERDVRPLALSLSLSFAVHVLLAQLYPGVTPPPGAYVPKSQTPRGTPRTAMPDPMITLLKRSMSKATSSGNNSPRTNNNSPRTTPSKTPDMQPPMSPKHSPKKGEERV